MRRSAPAVRLGGVVGNTFPHFSVRVDAFRLCFSVWISLLEMPLENGGRGFLSFFDALDEGKSSGSGNRSRHAIVPSHPITLAGPKMCSFSPFI
jgi:hypothetical protein